MKTIRRVTVNKDGRPRWKESDGIHRVSIRHCACDDGTTWSGAFNNAGRGVTLV